MRTDIFRCVAAAASILAAIPAMAGTPGPTDPIKAIFAKTKVEVLCNGSAFQPRELIGEIAIAYKLNVLTLPSVPQDAGIAALDAVEGRTAGWLIYRQQPNFKDDGLKAGQADLLDDIGTDLTDYVIWLGANGKQPFAQAPGATIPAIYDAQASQRLGLRSELLKRLLGQFLIGGDSRPVLQCVTASIDETRGSASGDGFGGGRELEFAFEVRGKIEDLAIPSKGEGSDKFKGASSASFAFTDNHEKGETSVVIDATMAAGYQDGRIESLLAFARYSQNTTETSRDGDDDDSKDIRALSPGIIYTHFVSIGEAVYGNLGLAAFPTLDFAQHARTGRVRLFFRRHRDPRAHQGSAMRRLRPDWRS